MTTYRTIASSETQPKAPVTSELMVALANNPTAIAEGSSGAPNMEVAWHELETITLGADASEVTFTTDISGYRAIRVRGGSKVTGTTPTFRVQVFIGASWRSVAEYTMTNNTIVFDAETDNIDDDGGGPKKFTLLRAADLSITLGTDWNAASFSASSQDIFGYCQYSGAATAVRCAVSTGDFDVSEGGTVFTLFGIKRTQP